MSDRVSVECPTCSTEIVLDPETGAVLSSRRPASKSGNDLDSMIAAVHSSKETRESIFEKSMSQQKHRDRILDARFREAVERAKESDEEPPLNPMDLD